MKIRNLLALAVLLASSVTTTAQTVPNKDFDPYKNPVTIVVPYSPGGPVDSLARILSAFAATKGINSSVINRPGSSGVLAVNQVLDSKADGYTLFMGEPGVLIMSPLLKKGLRYSEKTKFEHITVIGVTPMMIAVNPNVIKARTIQDFILEVKADPSKITYGAAAETSFYIGKAFFSKLGVDVPGIQYPGSAPSFPDLVSGRVPVAFGAAANNYFELEKAKQIVILANLSDHKIPEYPIIPMLHKVSLVWTDMVYHWWVGISAPERTPKYIAEFYNKLYNVAMNDVETRAKIEKLGFIVKGGSTQSTQEFIDIETIKFTRDVKKFN